MLKGAWSLQRQIPIIIVLGVFVLFCFEDLLCAKHSSECTVDIFFQSFHGSCKGRYQWSYLQMGLREVTDLPKVTQLESGSNGLWNLRTPSRCLSTFPPHRRGIRCFSAPKGLSHGRSSAFRILSGECWQMFPSQSLVSLLHHRAFRLKTPLPSASMYF